MINSKKICIGCGGHRFEGFLHIDSNPECSPDVCLDITEWIKAEVPKSQITDIIAWHVLEHLSWEELQPLIESLYQASENGAVWSIRVPHVSSIHAANPQHRCTFSTTFWDFYLDTPSSTKERYGKARFEILSTKVRILAYATGLTPRWLSKIMPNWIFNNFGKMWLMLCERFWPFRFDEIEWRLRVVK